MAPAIYTCAPHSSFDVAAAADGLLEESQFLGWCEFQHLYIVTCFSPHLMVVDGWRLL